MTGFRGEFSCMFSAGAIGQMMMLFMETENNNGGASLEGKRMSSVLQMLSLRCLGRIHVKPMSRELETWV